MKNIFSEVLMKFEKVGSEIGKLVDEKNAAYGSSFEKSEKILKVLYPNGIKPEQYKDMLAITRIVDKLFRIATDKDAFGESPFKDIAGYGILGLANAKEKK
jgi:ribosome biogenesis protein Nip4